MMNFKRFFSLIAILLFMASCSKTDSFLPNPSDELDQVNQLNIIDESEPLSFTNSQKTAYSQLYPEVALLRRTFINHLKHKSNISPWGAFPESMRATIQSRFEAEQLIMNTIGHNAYLDSKVTSGDITNDLSQTLKTIRNTTKNFNNSDFKLLAESLALQRDQIGLIGQDNLLATFVYDLIITIINDLFPPGAADLRDRCSLEDILDDIIKGATIGITAGGIILDLAGGSIGAVVAAGFTIPFTAVTAAYGAIWGGIIGLFNGDDCDCGPSLDVLVFNSSDTNCGVEWSLRAVGAGDDAELYNWTINEGNSSSQFFGEPALLSVPVTQQSPSVPLTVVVTTLCVGETDVIQLAENTFTKNPPINLFDLNFNTVGEIMIWSNYDLSSTINASVGNSDLFETTSTEGGVGDIDFSVSVVPPNLGAVTQNQDAFTINWQNQGAGFIQFSATNICSGLQTSKSISVSVGQ